MISSCYGRGYIDLTAQASDSSSWISLISVQLRDELLSGAGFSLNLHFQVDSQDWCQYRNDPFMTPRRMQPLRPHLQAAECLCRYHLLRER